jgi:hypothetical protein
MCTKYVEEKDENPCESDILKLYLLGEILPKMTRKY